MGPAVPKPEASSSVAANAAKLNQQTLAGTQTAQNTNQFTPFGSLVYNPIGTDQFGNTQYASTTNLSPQQQAILTNLQGSQIGLGGAGGNLVNASFDMYSAPPDFSELSGPQTQLNMARQASYMQPFFTQQNEQLDNQLRNQGIMPGTEAYTRAIRTLTDTQNQSMMSFLNQTQPIAFQQAQAQYNQPLQTLQGIFGLTQPASLTSNLVSTPRPNLQGVDYGSIANQYNQAASQQYQAKLGQYNALMSGIFGAGNAAMMMI
jgi:hypothetical protein